MKSSWTWATNVGTVTAFVSSIGLKSSSRYPLEGLDDEAVVAVWPSLLDTLIELLLANRDLFLVNQRNRKALQAFAEDGRHVDAGQDIEARFGRLLADPKIPLERRVRMAASVGAVVATLAAGEVFGDATADDVACLARGVARDVVRQPGDGL